MAARRGENPRSAPIAGSAVVTIVASSTTTNCATHMTATPNGIPDRVFPVKRLMAVTITHRTLFLVKSGLMETQVRELPVVGRASRARLRQHGRRPRGRRTGTTTSRLPGAARRGPSRRRALARRRRALADTVAPQAGAAAVRRAARTLRATLIDTFTALRGRRPRRRLGRPAPVPGRCRRHAELSPAARGFELRWDHADVPTRLLWPVAHAARGAARRPGPTASQALRGLPVAVPRPVQELQPALVRHERLRHPRQDPALRRPPRCAPRRAHVVAGSGIAATGPVGGAVWRV